MKIGLRVRWSNLKGVFECFGVKLKEDINDGSGKQLTKNSS